MKPPPSFHVWHFNQAFCKMSPKKRRNITWKTAWLRMSIVVLLVFRTPLTCFLGILLLMSPMDQLLFVCRRTGSSSQLVWFSVVSTTSLKSLSPYSSFIILQLPIIMLVAFSMCIVCLLMAGKFSSAHHIEVLYANTAENVFREQLSHSKETFTVQNLELKRFMYCDSSETLKINKFSAVITEFTLPSH